MPAINSANGGTVQLTGHFVCTIVFMEIYIRNMLSIRCVMVVELQLDNLGFPCRSIEIGKADIIGELKSDDLSQIRTTLQRCGLELVYSKKGILVDKIKSAIIEMVRDSNKQTKIRCSDFLVSKLNHDYTYLANVFSDMESTTIEQFIILTRVQVVKDLLIKSELNLNEISWRLNYSSVAHLSAQFKKITGLTPSQFRRYTIEVPQMCELYKHS